MDMLNRSGSAIGGSMWVADGCGASPAIQPAAEIWGTDRYIQSGPDQGV